MNNPFLKRLMKDETKDVIHTSTYGEAQNSGKMGTASSTSFLDRLKIDRNRSKVRGYNESKVVTETWENNPKAKKYEVAEDAMLNSNRGRGTETGNTETGKMTSDNRGRGTETSSQATGKADRMLGNRGGFSGRGAEAPSSAAGRTTPPPARKNPGIFR